MGQERKIVTTLGPAVVSLRATYDGAKVTVENFSYTCTGNYYSLQPLDVRHLPFLSTIGKNLPQDHVWLKRAAENNPFKCFVVYNHTKDLPEGYVNIGVTARDDGYCEGGFKFSAEGRVNAPCAIATVFKVYYSTIAPAVDKTKGFIYTVSPDNADDIAALKGADLLELKANNPVAVDLASYTHTKSDGTQAHRFTIADGQFLESGVLPKSLFYYPPQHHDAVPFMGVHDGAAATE